MQQMQGSHQNCKAEKPRPTAVKNNYYLVVQNSIWGVQSKVLA